MDYGRPGAFCGEVDPIRRRPCGTTRPRAEALRAETALPGPPNPEFLSPAPSCLDQPTRDEARHAGDARGSAASALAEPQMARDRLGPQRKRDDQAAGREGEGRRMPFSSGSATRKEEGRLAKVVRSRRFLRSRHRPGRELRCRPAASDRAQPNLDEHRSSIGAPA